MHGIPSIVSSTRILNHHWIRSHRTHLSSMMWIRIENMWNDTNSNSNHNSNHSSSSQWIKALSIPSKARPTLFEMKSTSSLCSWSEHGRNCTKQLHTNNNNRHHVKYLYHSFLM